MDKLEISDTLKKCVFRAEKIERRQLFLSKGEKEEISNKIHKGLVDLCKLAQMLSSKKGQLMQLTTADGSLPELVLRNIVTYRIFCLKKDYSTFSREIAKAFMTYAALPFEEQSMLCECKLVIQGGQVFILRTADSPATEVSTGPSSTAEVIKLF